MRNLLILLLSLSAGGTAMTLLLVLLRRLLGSRLPSRFWYWAWLPVLLRFLLPLPGLLPTGIRTAAAVPELPTHAVGPIRPMPSHEETWEGESAFAEEAEEAENPADGAAFAYEAPAEQAEQPVGGTDAVVTWEEPPAARIRDVLGSPRLWLSLWVIGFGLSAAGTLIGYGRFSRELRKSLRAPWDSDLAVYEGLPGRKPTLRRSASVNTPMLLGLRRPVLILPDRDYSPAMLRHILAHELCHYRRGDLGMKWLAVLASWIHWFNPIHLLIRSELDRACELACDEALLTRMDPEEKRRYGEMLLDMAAEKRLPRAAVATSFAVEKRNLKERLVQIMTYKKTGRTGLALALIAALLLTGCGAAMGPQTQQTPPEEPLVETPESVTVQSATPEETGAVHAVDSVDGLLAAIHPNSSITLAAGNYDLSTASDYGTHYDAGWYSWEPSFDGYELVIRNLEKLAITAQGETTISAVPRYADVLTFDGCTDVSLEGLTLGHSEAPGACSGGVIDMKNSLEIRVDSCSLYGCGVLGIRATNCQNVRAQGTKIYDCSDGAVTAISCRDLRLEDCQIFENGNKGDLSCSFLFYTVSCEGFAVVNCEIQNNRTNEVLRSEASREVYLLGSELRDNTILHSLFNLRGVPVIVDGCHFANPHSAGYYEDGDYGLYARDLEGNDLISFDMDRMERRDVSFEGFREAETVAVEGEQLPDGTMRCLVSNVDELLAAIGSDTAIVLEEGDYLLSDASDYGGYGSVNYYWQRDYDGFSLVITGVKNLSIQGQGRDKTRILTEPRYSCVLSVVNSEAVTLSELTAGHTQEPGSCSGNVLNLEGSRDLELRDCGLFGCGVLGIHASSCRGLRVADTEMYECSAGGAQLEACEDVSFTGCSIRDCKEGNNYLYLINTTVDWDGTLFDSCIVRFDGNEFESVLLIDGQTTITGPEYAEWQRKTGQTEEPVPTPQP